jgi:hypothetical protein
MTKETDPENLDEGISPEWSPEKKARILRFRERIYTPLTPEQIDHIEQEMKVWFDDGDCRPKLEPSFLVGLDWIGFQTREFPEYASLDAYRNPPEFITHAFLSLDAYAIALLASNISFSSFDEIFFCCALKQDNLDSKMYLKFVTLSQHGEIIPSSNMLELLSSFSELLRAREFNESSLNFLEGEGYPMRCAYPGRMVANVSRYLKDRPVDQWPVAYLPITLTEELRTRAQDILAFLRSSNDVEGKPS